MTSSEVAKLHDEYVAAWVRDDRDVAMSYWSDDIVMRAPGSNPHSGIYRGKVEVCRNLIDRIIAETTEAEVLGLVDRGIGSEHVFTVVHERFKTPHISTWIAGFAVGIPAGLWDIATFAELSNIGTLFAFTLVSASVIVLRRNQPDRPRVFRVPFVPLFPMISILCCVVLMLGLPLLSWIGFFVWLMIGLVIYFAYSQRRASA